MNIEKIILTVLILIIIILLNIVSFYIGFILGFKKCRRIDDEIIKELSDKYKK